jgi:hypothetical protein
MKTFLNEPRQGVTTYEVDDRREGSFVASQCLVTSVRVKSPYTHDLVSVWNRGELSGTLTVNKGDGIEIAKRLLAER